MRIPPIDFARWTLRTLKLLDEARRAVFPEPKRPARPKEPDRDRPDIW